MPRLAHSTTPVRTLLSRVLLLGVHLGTLTAAPSLIVVHHNHEGSHAVCQTLTQILDDPVDCDEQYDPYLNHGRIPFDKLNRANGTVLLRLMGYRFTHTLKAIDPKAVYIILVRTNLMLWSVSSYFFENRDLIKNETRQGQLSNPQFFAGVALPPPPVMDMHRLHRVAELGIKMWHRKLEAAKSMRELGRRATLAVYEAYLEGGADYLCLLLHRLGLSTPRCVPEGPLGMRAVQLKPNTKSNVYRVHDGTVRNAAQNYAQILERFTLNHSYPSFRDIAASKFPSLLPSLGG